MNPFLASETEGSITLYHSRLPLRFCTNSKAFITAGSLVFAFPNSPENVLICSYNGHIEKLFLLVKIDQLWYQTFDCVIHKIDNQWNFLFFIVDHNVSSSEKNYHDNSNSLGK